MCGVVGLRWWADIEDLHWNIQEGQEPDYPTYCSMFIGVENVGRVRGMEGDVRSRQMLTVPGHLRGTNALSGNKETRLEQEAIEATHTCYKLQPTSACQQRYTRPKRQSAPA